MSRNQNISVLKYLLFFNIFFLYYFFLLISLFIISLLYHVSVLYVIDLFYKRSRIISLLIYIKSPLNFKSLLYHSHFPFFHIKCTFILGYEHQEVALNCGTMLRECIRFEALAKIVLHSPHFFDFFKYVEVSTFDIASDAFATFKELLTRHKMLAADFFDASWVENLVG